MADNDSVADAEKLEVEILKNRKKTIWSMKLKLETLKLKVRQIRLQHLQLVPTALHPACGR